MKFGSKAKIDKEFADLEKWDTETVVSRYDAVLTCTWFWQNINLSKLNNLLKQNRTKEREWQKLIFLNEKFLASKYYCDISY